MKRSGYGVKLVRGPFVRLPPHPDKLPDFEVLLRERHRFRRPLAVDLFCGAGGLSLGLSDAGFDVVVGVDNDEDSLETHAHAFGGLTLDLDLSDEDVVTDLIERLTDLGPTLIAGGPPCQPFSRAGASKIRDLVANGQREAHDPRRDLWRTFLRIVCEVRPPVALLENVPDMALGGRMEIIRTIAHELERVGYTVHTRLLHAWEFAVPQYRQRLIMVATSRDIDFRWPEPSDEIVTVMEAIGDLPPVEGGARPQGGADGHWSWAPSEGGLTPFAERARAGLEGDEHDRVRDHITRPVRADDRQVFEMMRPWMRYTDLPPDLRRYRHDIFDDKYKRLDPDELSRSITAHIARDGYWYIHPHQPRTLTVREAARLQTFPDRMRFAGPPSSAFRQIGNAVPPRLGEVVATAVLQSLGSSRSVSRRPTSIETGRALASWLDSLDELVVPWADPPSAWTVVLGVRMLERKPPGDVAAHWPLLAKLVDPATTLDNAERLEELAWSLGRIRRVPPLLEAARRLLAHGAPSVRQEELVLTQVGKVTSNLASLAVGLAPAAPPGPVPVTAPLLRLVARFTGLPVDQERSRSDGRLEIARLIGGTLVPQDGDHDSHRALGGAVEAAARVCTPVSPSCPRCPLFAWCQYAKVSRERAEATSSDRST